MPTAEHFPTTHSLGATDRRDNWWAGPVAVAIGFTAFIVYATWAALQGNHYHWGPYLSPFYAPNLKQDWMPVWLSPALLILWAPGGFRATCYYYRKAYYRAFFFDPWGCAVGEGRGRGYNGERSFPFVLQNLHRFFLYIAILFVFILAYDSALAFIWPSAGGGYHEYFMGDEGALKMSEQPKYTKLYREARAPEWEPYVEQGLIAKPLSGEGAPAALKAWEKPRPKFALAAPRASVVDVRETAELSAWDIPVVLDKAIHQPHLENFFDAVRKDVALNCPAESAFASAVTVLKVNEAIAAQKMLTFAPSDFVV